jgi:hypothetical protein
MNRYSKKKYIPEKKEFIEEKRNTYRKNQYIQDKVNKNKHAWV